MPCAISCKPAVATYRRTAEISLWRIYPQLGGAAAFVLAVRSVPVFACYACWDSVINEGAWESAESTFLYFADIGISLDKGWRYREAPRPPWLVRIETQSFDQLRDHTKTEVSALAAYFTWALANTRLPN